MQYINYLDTPIEYLKGVGPKRAEVLRKDMNINTFRDLLGFFPFRYIDRSKFTSISDISGEMAYVQLRGKLLSIQTLGKLRSERLSAVFADHSGQLELIWFKGIKWIRDSLKVGQEYIVFGRPGYFNGQYNIAHPEMEPPERYLISAAEPLQPFYNSSEKMKSIGLDSKGIRKIVRNLLAGLEGHLPEVLSQEIVSQIRLADRETAYRNIHFPTNLDTLGKAQARLKFEELFFIQLRLIRMKVIRHRAHEGLLFIKVGEHVNHFYNECLPFPLTMAQKKVIREIRKDLGSGYQMNRLLQGDVGSGKTLVALMTMLIALDNGYQACMMAPTEILAVQHYNTLTGMLRGMDVTVGMLTGSVKGLQRKKILEESQSGELQILVGTHALIEETVKFSNLGFVVIDEQHRFGVLQRAVLLKKQERKPHVLVMTATPIPRTLAMTLYGDLEVSVIDELPPGRKPVRTVHYTDSARLKVFGFVRKQIAEGRQVYFVFPLIYESETLDLKYLMDGYEAISREFPLPDYSISIVHGQLKSSDRDYEMQRFLKKETQIMVATTVIEVGVDIPNASVMVIENAERFGLSQLHQLRGRVGRGADQSYCILMTGDKLTSEARQRIETMVRTTDGFEIAEADLRLRGPGDLTGTRQSGIIDLKIADIVKDEKILRYARNVATDLLNRDPGLSEPKNAAIAAYLKFLENSIIDFGQIA